MAAETSNLSTLLTEAAHGWALSAADAEERAAAVRSRPIVSAGTPVEADERARNQREAEKLDRIAAAYDLMTEGAQQGFLVLPQDVTAYIPDFMQRHGELVRIATAAGRIEYRQPGA